MVMGLTGLLLCGFVAAHLAGNLKLFVGAKSFNEYAHFLHSLEILPVAEAGLLLLFVAHVYLAFVTAAGNTAARLDDYSMKQSKQPRRQSKYLDVCVGGCGSRIYCFASD